MDFLTLFSHGPQNSFQCCIQHFKPIGLSKYKTNPVKSLENIVIQTILSPITPLAQVLYNFSCLTIVYPNLRFNSSSIKLLVPMSTNCRPPPHHTVLFRLNYS